MRHLLCGEQYSNLSNFGNYQQTIIQEPYRSEFNGIQDQNFVAWAYTNTFINEEDTLFLEGNVEQDITQMAFDNFYYSYSC
jgi:adenylate cyclase